MKDITLDLVARLPRPGTAIPSSFVFSHDGKMVTFLDAPEGGLRRVLCAMDLATAERRVLFDPGAGVTDHNVSREEQLRRERARQMDTGVTSYAWATDADVILVPLGGEIWIVTPDGVARSLGVSGVDPQISPDGSRVAFVRDGDLYVADAASGAETRLTGDATGGVTNGLADFCAQEELGRFHGFWWSPDGARIAYQHTDERNVPPYTIPHWGTDDPNEVETHRYPFAGADNPRVRLGVVESRAGATTTWLDLPGDTEYLARVDWHPDGRLFVQTLDRAQGRLTLSAYEVATGARATLIEEVTDPWVNVHDDLRFVKATGEFSWSSERSGTRQLYLYDARGSFVRQITDHGFPIDGVIALDGDSRRVEYTAATTPVEQHVYGSSLDVHYVERWTTDGGFNAVAFSDDLRHRVVTSSARSRAPRATVDGRDLFEPPSYGLPIPELFTFDNRDGVVLHGMVFKPARLPAPLIVRVYGGPHAQTVTDGWGSTVDLRAQLLAQRGFVVMSVDNRGSARRGLAFEAPLHRRMGSVEVDDQVDGVRFAHAQGWADADRVGMYGWSYGGYMTIMSMLKAPEVFKVGVAGAPVTDWAGYDTCYTERYMGTPHDNPDGYRDASALTHAANLRGKLMIVHGMIDENVHFRHTARFVRALAAANKSADLLVYPEERHSPRSERDRRNMEERITGYFETHL